MHWWRGLSPRRRALFAVLAAAALGAAVALAGVAAFGSGGGTRSGLPPQDHPGPVILVPGYGGSQDSLRVLAQRLQTTGRETRIVTLPGNGTGDLLAQVAVLDQTVNEALAAGAPSVDVIGYSAGGVVARLWVARKAGEHRARRVITLGSPLHGTTLAATGGVVVPDACPLACQQLTPGSALLTSVERDPVPLPWLSIWTENDQTVTPPDSARLDGAENVLLQQVCPNVHIEHSDLPANDLVGQLVEHALTPAGLGGVTTGIRCPS